MTTKPTTRKIAGKTYILTQTTHDAKEAKAAAARIRKTYGTGSATSKKLGEGLYGVYRLQSVTRRPANKYPMPQRRPAKQLPKWTPGNMEFKSGELLSNFPPKKEMKIQQKLAATDNERRSRAHRAWISAGSQGTVHEIYLRLYASDAKKFSK